MPSRLLSRLTEVVTEPRISTPGLPATGKSTSTAAPTVIASGVIAACLNDALDNPPAPKVRAPPPTMLLKLPCRSFPDLRALDLIELARTKPIGPRKTSASVQYHGTSTSTDGSS